MSAFFFVFFCIVDHCIIHNKLNSLMNGKMCGISGGIEDANA